MAGKVSFNLLAEDEPEDKDAQARRVSMAAQNRALANSRNQMHGEDSEFWKIVPIVHQGFMAFSQVPRHQQQYYLEDRKRGKDDSDTEEEEEEVTSDGDDDTADKKAEKKEVKEAPFPKEGRAYFVLYANRMLKFWLDDKGGKEDFRFENFDEDKLAKYGEFQSREINLGKIMRLKSDSKYDKSSNQGKKKTRKAKASDEISMHTTHSKGEMYKTQFVILVSVTRKVEWSFQLQDKSIRQKWMDAIKRVIIPDDFSSLGHDPSSYHGEGIPGRLLMDVAKKSSAKKNESKYKSFYFLLVHMHNASTLYYFKDDLRINKWQKKFDTEPYKTDQVLKKTAKGYILLDGAHVEYYGEHEHHDLDEADFNVKKLIMKLLSHRSECTIKDAQKLYFIGKKWDDVDTKYVRNYLDVNKEVDIETLRNGMVARTDAEAERVYKIARVAMKEPYVLAIQTNKGKEVLLGSRSQATAILWYELLHREEKWHEALGGAVTKHGYLDKKGGGKRRANWKRRYFAIILDHIFYFKNKTIFDDVIKKSGSVAQVSIDECIHNAAGYILLADIVGKAKAVVIEDDVKREKHPFHFVINTNAPRTYHVCGNSKTDMDDWIRRINKQVSRKERGILSRVDTVAPHSFGKGDLGDIDEGSDDDDDSPFR